MTKFVTDDDDDYTLMPPLCDDDGPDTRDDPNLGCDEPSVSNMPDSDDFVRRQERVRAKKAGEWIDDLPSVIANLSSALIATSGNEHYMYFLLQGQSLTTWTGQYGMQTVPLVQYSHLQSSPAVRVLDYYISIQLSQMEDASPAIVGRGRQEHKAASKSDILLRNSGQRNNNTTEPDLALHATHAWNYCFP